MPVRGEADPGDNELKWEIIQWHDSNRDRTFGRPRNAEPLRNNMAVEWIRVKVTDADDSNYGRYITFFGPFDRIEDQITGEIEAMFRTGEYTLASLA